ncbi:Co-chaperone for ATPase activity [Schizosaccharomyces cryophilus OY26]|uniref:Co-chaperone for ATPase activity n=1 Tax=Schizosaccharomyces cryophilus (strain OY26 / ATCC MYA-4695 / CBS 11777 / NBRC 106824 / NRRL Y48691) TaxID=653667 RepID=S9W1K7_SCHCR|nr:Co-chaperone for ATPase activity [Schizosaccharomyces cryophilus OY26]EPY51875.1 Co-chaperone for ATPase activity [Schizosaccharomyces cryophilus OY26]
MVKSFEDMDCYEILQVDRSSTLQEIKASYRKLALQYHPDRHPNKEGYDEIFAGISSAYNILSNEDKRKWHEKDYTRDQYSVFTDEIQEMQTKLEKVNFGVWVNFLNRIRIDEQTARSTVEWPSLGDITWLWTHTKPFYQKWLRFSTSKSFEWEAIYNEEEETDPGTKRLMKNENQKCIKYSIRQYDEAVRALIATMCKLDPRRQNVKKISDPERYESLQAASRKQSEHDRRNYQDSLKKQSLASWTVVDQELNWSEDEDEDESSSTDMTEAVDITNCSICNKYFRSLQQLKNHENSKKHKQNFRKARKKQEKDAKIAPRPFEASGEASDSSKKSEPLYEFSSKSVEDIERSFTFIEMSDDDFFTAHEFSDEEAF